MRPVWFFKKGGEKLKKLFFLIVFFCALLMTKPARATPFTNAIDFGSGDSSYVSFINYFGYRHVVDGLANPLILDNATLSLRHQGNRGDENEVWFLYGEGIFVGELSDSDPNWYTDSWALNSSILSAMSIQIPWQLQIISAEYTDGNDQLKFDWSKLSGNYHYPSPPCPQVPEPATMLLLGSLGAGMFGFKKLRKKINK